MLAGDMLQTCSTDMQHHGAPQHAFLNPETLNHRSLQATDPPRNLRLHSSAILSPKSSTRQDKNVGSALVGKAAASAEVLLGAQGFGFARIEKLGLLLVLETLKS